MCIRFLCIYKCICIPTKGIFCFSWNAPSRLFSLGAIRTKILKGTHCLLGLIDWKASPSRARFENNKSFKYQKDSVITSIVIDSHLFPYLIYICLQSNFPHMVLSSSTTPYDWAMAQVVRQHWWSSEGIGNFWGRHSLLEPTGLQRIVAICALPVVQRTLFEETGALSTKALIFKFLCLFFVEEY